MVEVAPSGTDEVTLSVGPSVCVYRSPLKPSLFPHEEVLLLACKPPVVLRINDSALRAMDWGQVQGQRRHVSGGGGADS
eukprot:1962268-Rhodomonas_salina.1